MPWRGISVSDVLSRVGKAIRYTLPRWDGLIRFLGDGCIDLDRNAAERAIRPLALNRKNALLAGSGEGGDNGAVIATLISLANGHPVSRIDKLLPHAQVG